MKARIKLILRRFFLINSFCRKCGVDVRDYQAPNKVWEQIKDEIPNGNTLCYNCFCKLCDKKGIDYGGYWILRKG